jgi:hypothetical protein
MPVRGRRSDADPLRLRRRTRNRKREKERGERGMENSLRYSCGWLDLAVLSLPPPLRCDALAASFPCLLNSLREVTKIASEAS